MSRTTRGIISDSINAHKGNSPERPAQQTYRSLFLTVALILESSRQTASTHAQPSRFDRMDIPAAMIESIA
jgi:hypothetical protein